jgi:hypothetical protein
LIFYQLGVIYTLSIVCIRKSSGAMRRQSICVFEPLFGPSGSPRRPAAEVRTVQEMVVLHGKFDTRGRGRARRRMIAIALGDGGQAASKSGGAVEVTQPAMG